MVLAYRSEVLRVYAELLHTAQQISEHVMYVRKIRVVHLPRKTLLYVAYITSCTDGRESSEGLHLCHASHINELNVFHRKKAEVSFTTTHRR